MFAKCRPIIDALSAPCTTVQGADNAYIHTSLHTQYAYIHIHYITLYIIYIYIYIYIYGKILPRNVWGCLLRECCVHDTFDTGL